MLAPRAWKKLSGFGRTTYQYHCFSGPQQRTHARRGVGVGVKMRANEGLRSPGLFGRDSELSLCWERSEISAAARPYAARVDGQLES